MFFWLELPDGIDATALLPKAVEAGMAFVPGAAFYAARAAKPNTLRLSLRHRRAGRGSTAGIAALAARAARRGHVAFA